MPSNFFPLLSGSHGTSHACHTLDTPLHMTDNRLSSLVMLAIEASCVRCVDLDDVIKAFPRQKTRSQAF